MFTGSRIRVAQYGVGPIGAEIIRLLSTKSWASVVAAVDVDPQKIGRDVADVAGLDTRTGIIVAPHLEPGAQVVCHTTSSRLSEVAGQLAELLEAGCHVISTCEELAYPGDSAIRERLQHIARAKNVTLLGTGVNPGFVMDKLPLTLSAVCQRVDSVRVERVVDASTRREPLQRKIGAGLTPEEFEENVAAGKIRHMGLRESLLMIADGMSVALDRVSEETVRPVIAEEDVSTGYLAVQKGRVAGVHQTIEGSGAHLRISLDIRMYVGAQNPRDLILIKGHPDLTVEIQGGVHGDRATAAMVVNAIPRVVLARPGVLTMDDIPVGYM